MSWNPKLHSMCSCNLSFVFKRSHFYPSICTLNKCVYVCAYLCWDFLFNLFFFYDRLSAFTLVKMSSRTINSLKWFFVVVFVTMMFFFKMLLFFAQMGRVFFFHTKSTPSRVNRRIFVCLIAKPCTA